MELITTLENGRQRVRPQTYSDDVQSDIWTVAFSPDGKTLASAGCDGVVKLWDPVTGEERVRLGPAHADEVRSVVFSPNGKVLASSSLDGTIRLWAVNANNE
jgi:WD40 repeat protein